MDAHIDVDPVAFQTGMNIVSEQTQDVALAATPENRDKARLRALSAAQGMALEAVAFIAAMCGEARALEFISNLADGVKQSGVIDGLF